MKHFQISPISRVAVVGIGGLGHLALQFLKYWGCEVTAFTSNPAKHDEVKRLGAHHVVDSRDPNAMQKLRGKFDLILVTVNVPLDWEAFIQTLAPRGRLHFVGAVLEPIPVSALQLLGEQRSVSASPIGSLVTIQEMLDFCARHQIAPVVERYPIAQVNEAFDHLRAGKARYRIVLDVENGF